MDGDMQSASRQGNGSLTQRLRGLLIRAPFATRADLTGKNIIVTGATPGSLGFETARILASWGAHVVVTTRSDTPGAVAALQAALDMCRRSNVEGHRLDLCDRASVETFARWCATAGFDRVDVLVNNAGIHLDLLSQWQQPRLTADGFELHWRTNYLGTAHLTELLLPNLLRAAASTGDARIVNVVSRLHRMGSNAGILDASQPYDSWIAYGNSKLALVHFTFELQRRFSSHKLQAYCLHPGAVVTNIAGKGLAGNPLIESVRNIFAPVERFFLNTVEEGAQTVLYCASEKMLQGGSYFQRCRVSSPGADALDGSVSARLWNDMQAWIAA
jgi:NAD(P)-dependent dehydrogenase (short-subunit alcohol dehydrogenase family)